MRTGYSTREKRIRELEDLRRRINYGIGLLEGRVAAVETAKSVFIPWNGRDVCLDATVNAGPFVSCGINLTGSTFELRDAADTTTIATLSGTTVSFTGQDGTVSYKVRMSKSGYHSKTSSTLTPGCGGTSSTSLSTWPTTMVLTGTISFIDVQSSTLCPMDGATVSVSGDGTGSDVTDSAGAYSLTATTSSTSQTQSLTMTVTPPSGVGAAVRTITGITEDACSPSTRNSNCSPDADHVGVVCNGRYMPEITHWADDYGDTDAIYDGSYWVGQYTYESTNCIKEISCGGVPTEVTDQTGDINVSVQIASELIDCTTTKFTAYRMPNFTQAPIDCSGTILTKCQPAVDVLDGFPAIDPSYYVEESVSCSSSISVAFTLPALTYAPYDDCEVEETGVDILWTGTV